MVFQVQAYLEFFQYTNVGRSAALMMVLWAITYFLSKHLHQAVAEAARARAGGILMERVSPLESVIRTVLILLVLVFFLFPIFWILLMSFQTNDQILRIPPSIVFEPTIANYATLITGKLQTTAGNLDVAFLRNLGNSMLLSTGSVILSLILGVPAAMLSRGSSSAWARTSPSPCSASASRRRCWSCCR